MATPLTRPENINTSRRKRISRPRRKVAMSQFGNAKTMAHGNYPWTWQSRRSDPLKHQACARTNEPGVRPCDIRQALMEPSASESSTFDGTKSLYRSARAFDCGPANSDHVCDGQTGIWLLVAQSSDRILHRRVR